MKLGVMGCESYLSQKAAENQIALSNPCFDVMTKHLHKHVRDYSKLKGTGYTKASDYMKPFGRACYAPPTHVGKKLTPFKRAFFLKLTLFVLLVRSLKNRTFLSASIQSKNEDHPKIIAPPPLIYLFFVLLGLGAHYFFPIPMSSEHKDSTRIYIVTGPNMSGKSTFIRMISINLALSEAGLPGFFKAMRFSPMKINSSIEANDDIESGKSFYDAQSDRLLSVARESQKTTPSLNALDEILRGTNHEEKQAGEYGFLKLISETPHLYILATHDLTMPELEGVIPGIRNLHLEEVDVPDELKFTHKILEGATPHRNGLKVLRIKGFPRAMLSAADEWLKDNIEDKRVLRHLEAAGIPEDLIDAVRAELEAQNGVEE